MNTDNVAFRAFLNDQQNLSCLQGLETVLVFKTSYVLKLLAKNLIGNGHEFDGVRENRDWKVGRQNRFETAAVQSRESVGERVFSSFSATWTYFGVRRCETRVGPGVRDVSED